MKRNRNQLSRRQTRKIKKNPKNLRLRALAQSQREKLFGQINALRKKTTKCTIIKLKWME